MQRPLVRMLGEDGALAEDATAAAEPAAVFGDLAQESGDSAAMGGGLEMSPARQRREDDLLGFGEGGGGGVFTAALGLIEASAIEPCAVERFASSEGGGAVDAGPVLRPLDEALFDALAEDVGEPLDLRLLLFRDDDGAIAACPELVAPVLPTSRARLPAR